MKTAQSKPPNPPPTLPFPPGPAKLKRKKERKGKEVMDASKPHPPQEEEA